MNIQPEENTPPQAAPPLGPSLPISSVAELPQVTAPAAVDLQHTPRVLAPAAPAALAPALTFKTRARCGKIARLPTDIRDMVNRMLRDAVPYERIVAALDEIGIRVTERN